MDITETAEEKSFRTEVSTLLQTTIPSALRNAESFEDRLQADRILSEGGLLGYTWPDRFGGAGGDPIRAQILDDEMTIAGIPASRSPSRFGIHLLGPTLMKHGSDEQQRRFLPRVLKVQDVWCQGFSEPDAGSDLANIQAYATADGDVFRLTGTKVWTTQAEHADWCLFLAKTSHEAPRHRNLSYLLVDMRQAGIEIQPITQLTNVAAFSQVFFNDVEVPKENVVGEVGKGWEVALTTLTAERSYGQLSRFRLYEQQVQRLARLIAQARPERDFNRWVSELGEVYADVRAIRALSYRIVSLAAAGEDVGHLGPVIKIWWSETHQRVCDLGFEVAAAVGEDEDYWYHAWLNVRAETIYAGSSEIQRNIISERVLKLPR